MMRVRQNKVEKQLLAVEPEVSDQCILRRSMGEPLVEGCTAGLRIGLSRTVFLV